MTLSAAYRPFVQWVLSRLGATIETRGNQIRPSSEAGLAVSDLPAWRFVDAHAPRSPDDVRMARRAIDALARRAVAAGLWSLAEPVDQPAHVQPIAEALFAAYQLDGGHLQLAGCQLEDHWFCCCRWDDRTTYAAGNGQLLAANAATSLGLERLQALAPTQGVEYADLAGIVGAVLELSDASGAMPQHLTSVRCRYAIGKTRVSLAETVLEFPFEGWASNFRPPPLVCPTTGRETFHLSSTDDGRFAAAEEIACCWRTGRRVLRRELAQCAISGRTMLPRFRVTCPVSGETIDRDAVVECVNCRQTVSPHAVEAGVCGACRGLAVVEPDDSRLAPILAANPGYKGWRRFRLAETANSYIVVMEGLWQRRLVVLDHDDLACRYTAIGQRWPAGWTTMVVGG